MTADEAMAENLYRAQVMAAERLADSIGQIAALRDALQWFLNDPRFQVGVGGNPRVVMRMIADARAVLAATEPIP